MYVRVYTIHDIDEFRVYTVTSLVCMFAERQCAAATGRRSALQSEPPDADSRHSGRWVWMHCSCLRVCRAALKLKTLTLTRWSLCCADNVHFQHMARLVKLLNRNNVLYDLQVWLADCRPSGVSHYWVAIVFGIESKRKQLNLTHSFIRTRHMIWCAATEASGAATWLLQSQTSCERGVNSRYLLIWIFLFRITNASLYKYFSHIKTFHVQYCNLTWNVRMDGPTNKLNMYTR